MPYPAKKNPALLAEVVERIALGQTLAALGRELGFHPTKWGEWCRADEALGIAYAQARETGQDVIADEVMQIIDSVPAQSEEIQRAKLRAEMRLKLLAKWNPKRWGDRLSTELSNKEGETLKVEGTADTAAIAASLAAAMRDAKRGDK
jgi:hypothetical protein